MSGYLLEVCVDSLDGLSIADEAGAHRIELCSALDVGGLTPSHGTLVAARAATSLPIMAMIRPRPGDFVYSDEEVALMETDIAAARDLGANGVVFGALDDQGNVDRRTLDRLLAAAAGLDVTFHRAFDVAADAGGALDTLIDAGVPRVLTSGLAPTAPEGVAVIRSLIARADGRIVVMPGCGLRSTNIRGVRDEIGAIELHASASTALTGGRAFEGRKVTDGEEIARIHDALRA